MRYYFQNKDTCNIEIQNLTHCHKRGTNTSPYSDVKQVPINNINVIYMLIHWLNLCTHGRDIDTLIKPLKGAKRVLQWKQQNHASNVDVDMAILNKMTNSK